MVMVVVTMVTVHHFKAMHNHSAQHQQAFTSRHPCGDTEAAGMHPHLLSRHFAVLLLVKELKGGLRLGPSLRGCLEEELKVLQGNEFPAIQTGSAGSGARRMSSRMQ